MAFLRDQLADVTRKVLLYLSVGRFEAAEKLLRSTLADHGTLANICNLLGLTFHRQSRFTEAVREFKRAIQGNPNFIEATLNLTATLCDLSRYDEARELYDTLAIHARPHRPLPALNLGRLANLHAKNGLYYEQSGMIQDAIQEFRKAISLYPNMPDVRLSLAQLYLRTNLLDKAQGELEEILKADETATEAHTLLGLVFHKRGRRELARDCWVKAQQTSPTDVTARAYLRVADFEATRRG